MRWIFGLVFLFSFLNSKAESHALLIGVSEYPTESGWSNLSSYNDLLHIEQALILNGFKGSNIKKVEDELATYDSILDCFQKLIDKVKSGDVVYVHFSGHGQQVIDDNADEIDGLDEAIVPYDSPKEFQKNVYEGQKLIRDDALQSFSLELRNKLGPLGQLILVLDSCNSGTGVRGQHSAMTRVRGTSKIMGSDAKILKIKKRKIDKDHGMDIYSNAKLAPMATYYSTQARELNYETYDAQLKPIGSLSYAIATILGRAKGEITFQELYERIVQHMFVLSPRQHPQWEGSRTNVIFKNDFKATPGNFHSISKHIDSTTIEIEVGTLSGVFQNSKIELYSFEEQKVISYGFVRSANLTHSQIELMTPYVPQFDDLHKVRIVSYSLGSFELAIRFDIDAEDMWSQTIKDIKKMPFITVSECNADLYIETNANSLALKDIDGISLFECLKSNCQNALMNRIFEFGHAKLIKQYYTQNTEIQFSVEVLKSNCKKVSERIRDLKQLYQAQVKVGDCIQIVIKNTGSSAAYFTLLDIQPDNKINVILPYRYSNKTKEDLYLEPNQEYLTDFIIDVGEPLGKETLKLIATDKPISLSSILERPRSNTRGLKKTTSLVEFFYPTEINKSSDLSERKSSNFEKIGITTYVFEIVK